MENKSYFIDTYGCQMNLADSELVKTLLMDAGYQPASKLESADAIFVNTCAIRDHAEQKVHSQLGRYSKIKESRRNIIIGVLGCMAQSLKHDLLEKKPYVDIVLGPDSYRKLPDLLNRVHIDQSSVVDTTLSRYEVYDNLYPSRQEGINAWISIMRGCDKFCTFCVVPFTRGRERSRNSESIIKEAKKAVIDGFVEVTLLGQNVNSYEYNGYKFHQLLEKVAQVPSLKRIRYTSPHPKDITNDLLDVMASNDNICKNIHLPLQAGNDKILNRMNRTYTRKYFLNLVDNIRQTIPGVGISTDIIVGFPGETDIEFQDTIRVMENVKFDSAFMFKYSSRRGTKASEYEDHINDTEKQERLEKVIELQKMHSLERNNALIGKHEIVLVEKNSKKSTNKWAGRTDTNKWVIFDKEDAQIKDMVKVEITDSTGVSLRGALVKE
ncbi:MAG: tRNA (N6-isopentenyl adenosine(37)-C2)-methylthiotransferase MiaB [Candidatus Marinimicrobia bacterium]|nr:tRNA (N6-isopentenyl adenosine(37)-C2)-methylthiotransferase MiaB [Candidatus Neomarinimicrobiota bacterium]|tara:strand:- start:5172 stop:6485 length:1314 start_codon:yes stop_codon:yes gene_type:complete